MPTPHRFDAAAAVSCPVTYILGAMDKMTPPKRAADLIAATEGATVVTLPSVGHMMMSEAPDATRRAMVDALESVRA